MLLVLGVLLYVWWMYIRGQGAVTYECLYGPVRDRAGGFIVVSPCSVMDNRV